MEYLPKAELLGLCPKCGHKQVCPCESCNNPKELNPWIWEGDNIKCSNCGLTKYAGWWEDFSYSCFQLTDQYIKREK